ncbi:hypothetical protein MTS1_01577 [Microbacterium sp. TS-1]|uniref:hypothetical protein n=1 Tax=Microbacterium TaxID=33882 RepID=UPI00038F8B68|nr:MULTISPECIES: hypothetical protein [Microbacterium]APF34365.1 hypothetical protein BO218_09345 [Microbacterium paludicola]POX68080.1 hypothetical protein C3481_07920 [Microbacterium sp. Ru50]GAD34215.1 hypothetical protein MTS1_01577 [Microbacterium sp. TS-1]
MTTTRTTAASALLLLSALALAGCATTPGGAAPGDTGASGSDTGSAAPSQDADVEAAWLDGGRAVGLVTYGSSSCQPVVGEVTASGQTVTVALTDPEGAACTRDYVPRASYVGLPAGVDPTQDVDIVVTGGYTGDADLDGVAGLEGPTGEVTGDMVPSAGWFDDAGLVLLTWGSSSCPPVFETVALDGDAVRATEAAGAADQVCTMDYAPRLSVLGVDGVSDDARPGEIVLVSPAGDEQRIAVIG